MCQESALPFAPMPWGTWMGGQGTPFPLGHHLPLQGWHLHPCPLGAAVPQDKGLDGSRSCPKPVMGSGACWGGRGQKSGADGIHLEGSGIIPVNTSYALRACTGVIVAFQD